MARKKRLRGPWWRGGEGRWYATVDGRKVRFPEDIGEKDEGKAWVHYETEMGLAANRVAEAQDPTVGGVLQLYIAHLERKADAGRVTRQHYRNRQSHLGHFARFGDVAARKARTLRPRDLEAFAVDLSRRYSAHYARACGEAVRAAFNWAARYGSRADGGRLLAESPVSGAKLESPGHPPERFAERSAAASWLAFLRRRSNGVGFENTRSRQGIPGRAGAFRESPTGRLTRNFALLQRVLIRTGARPGELASLQWSMIVWDAGTTPEGNTYAKAVIPWWDKAKDRPGWKNARKTKKDRVIFFSAILTRALRRESGRPWRHSTHVFQSRRGTWGDGTALAARTRDLRPLAVAASGGKLAMDGPGRLVNYLFRHTAITTYILMGIDVPTVAELMGTSVKVITNTYLHIVDSHLAEAFHSAGRAREANLKKSRGSS